MTGSVSASEKESGGAGNSEEGSAAKQQVTKRKYGNPEAPVKEKTLLVTKNERVRHSHACDRCRLKKVRCDGLKPSCSQCSRANFRCTTSDKLTRRGFPKGYTEMLELEVVRLQKLVDEGAKSAGGTDNEVKLEEPKSRAPDSAKRNDPMVTEPQFPFINDTFHYYENFVCEENYLGHRTWDVLRNVGAVEASASDSEVEVLKNQQLLSMTSLLQLQPSTLWLPRFLAMKYDDNLRDHVQIAIARFSKTQNSLIPLLSPFDKWQVTFDQHFKCIADPDPINLLALLYIVQMNWSCMNEFILFKVTKIVCSSATTSLRNLQCLLLACFYFMGSENHTSFASELLHLAFSMVLDLGLFINSKKLAQLAKATIKHDQRIVTFWTFQFLDSWWSLIQGFPKSNFIFDEFHPRKIESLDKPCFKPFSLLLDFTTDSLDGCNLLHTLSTENSNGKSKLIYLAESFRHLLVKWKLYHQLQDHEEHFNRADLNMSLALTKPDIIETQLTLFYLVITFLTEQRLKNDNATRKKGTNLEDTAFEILSLYYLLLLDQSESEQPLQFTVLHILPCSNKELINSCLSVLNDWAIKPQEDNEFEGQSNWKYNKYQNFLMQWCQLYYDNEPYDPMLIQLSLSYKIHLAQDKEPSKWKKRDYLQEVEQYSTGNALSRGRSKLLSSNSQAIMNQFDMFSNGNSRTNIFCNFQASALPNQSLSNATQLTQNDNNNIIDMSNFKSQILIEHEETDDGYAEDDDEDDEEEEDSKPLEIPFTSKRTGSLFQTKQNLPPSHRGQKLEGTKERRTSILESQDFSSHNQPPQKRARHNSERSANQGLLQNSPYSSTSSRVYHHYSTNTPTRNVHPTNNDIMTSNSHGEILPPPPLPSHEGLFDHSVKISTNSSINTGSTNPARTPQIVETPRAFADILLLHSPDQHETLNDGTHQTKGKNISPLYK